MPGQKAIREVSAPFQEIKGKRGANRKSNKKDKPKEQAKAFKTKTFKAKAFKASGSGFRFQAQVSDLGS